MRLNQILIRFLFVIFVLISCNKKDANKFSFKLVFENNSTDHFINYQSGKFININYNHFSVFDLENSNYIVKNSLLKDKNFKEISCNGLEFDNSLSMKYKVYTREKYNEYFQICMKFDNNIIYKNILSGTIIGIVNDNIVYSYNSSLASINIKNNNVKYFSVAELPDNDFKVFNNSVLLKSQTLSLLKVLVLDANLKLLNILEYHLRTNEEVYYYDINIIYTKFNSAACIYYKNEINCLNSDIYKVNDIISVDNNTIYFSLPNNIISYNYKTKNIKSLISEPVMFTAKYFKIKGDSYFIVFTSPIENGEVNHMKSLIKIYKKVKI